MVENWTVCAKPKLKVSSLKILLGENEKKLTVL